MRKRHITDEECKLFQDMMRQVHPLTRKKDQVKKNKDSSLLRHRHAMPSPVDDTPYVSAQNTQWPLPQYNFPPISGSEIVLCRKPGLQKKTFEKMRRGHMHIQAELDLHGLKVDNVTQVLSDFIYQCQLNRKKCVLIIHGKGNGSKGHRPILKGQVSMVLREYEAVLGFCSAQSTDGGTGSVYALLRRL